MNVIVLDPRTGSHVVLTVPRKPLSEQQARRQVLRKLDQLEAQKSRH